MPVSIQCPNPACGKSSVAPDDVQGRRVKCKHCGVAFVAATTMDGTKETVTPSRPALPGSAPQMIGRFQVRAKLGAGAFGVVYRAYDPQLDREVALKVPNAAVLDSPKRVERFLREARAAAGLRHPHIVPVYDAGKDGDRYYIASAFIAGKKLADTFDEGGTDFRRAARLTQELCEALAYAHEMGIVHRDVKPDNIMVDAADHVHLMDFGLAARQDEESRLTNDGAVLGTPSYMAPEQARGQDGEAKAAADQYSAGVVLYELLTGRVPFEGPPALVIHSQIHTEPERPSQWRRRLPLDLETICLKALAKGPEKRYRSCGAMAADLRRWLDGDPIAARRLGPWEQVARWARKNKAVAGLSAVAVGCLVVGMLVSAIFAMWAGIEARRANAEARRADEEAMAAGLEKEKAVEERRKAVEAGKEIRRRAYNAAMLLVQFAWERSDVERMQDMLVSQVPRTGEDDLRGFEWYYWQGRLRSGVSNFSGCMAPVAYSPDGSRIASGGGGRSVRVWDVKTGKDLFSPKPTNCRVDTLAFSPDGSRIALNGPEGTVQLWDAGTGKEVLSFAADQALAVWSLAFDADGSRLAGGCHDGTLRVWDAKTGKELLSFKWGKWPVKAVAFTANGSRVVSGSGDGTVRVWDARTGKELLILKGHPGMVMAVACSPDGSRMASAGEAVQVWDVKKGHEALTLRGHLGAVRSVAFSPDGSRLVSGSDDRTVRVWDVASGQELMTFKGHTDMVTCVAFSPDGSRIASGAGNNTPRVAPAGGDDTVRIWEAEASPREPRLSPQVHAGSIWSHAFGPRWQRVATYGKDDIVRVLDPRTGKELLTLKGHTRGRTVGCVAYSPDGSRIASGGPEGTVRVWSARTGKELLALKGHMGGAIKVAFSPDGSRLATAEYAGRKQVRVWDVKVGKELFTLEGHTRAPTEVAFSPDGSRLALCDEDGLRVCDARTGKELLTIRLANVFWGRVCIAPDNSRLASSGGSATVRLWDLRTGKELLTLPVHRERATAMVFSPDGSRLATADRYGMVRLWDVETGQEMLALPQSFFNPVSSLSFNADGSRLLYSNWDLSVQSWDATRLPK